ncbi:hypothetical protein VPHF86_0224 [Vibrio phage F86]
MEHWLHFIMGYGSRYFAWDKPHHFLDNDVVNRDHM